MIIRSVVAHAFGPLVDDELAFADGLTVVYGRNESAKSSWHAATYAALCGRRRRAGRQDAYEQRLVVRHKPWDRTDWLVSAQILLADGRRVELRHDLAGKVACAAKDLELGTDYSAEIMFDGAPDGSRWLGLDRRSFAATACTFQTEVLAVLGRADGLQDHLQRAAATAGTDTSAPAALACIDSYRREQIGNDQANSTKPLRRAIVAQDRALADLAAARAAHTAYEERQVEVDQLRSQAALARRRLAVHEAAAALADARAAQDRAAQAAALAQRLGGWEPSQDTAPDQHAAEVAAALLAWEALPDQPPAVAPAGPGGAARGDGATGRTSSTRSGQSDVDSNDSLPAQLLELARQLDLAMVDSAAAKPGGRRRHRIRRAGRAGWWLIVVGLVLLGSGVAALWYAGSAAGLLALGLAGLGVLLAAAGVAARVAAGPAPDLAAIRQRCAELGAPADPDVLRELALARVQAAGRADVDEVWRRRLDEHRAAVGQRVVAAARGVGLASDDVASAAVALPQWFRQYEQDLAGRRQDWASLQGLCAGRSVSQLAAECAQAQARASRLVAALLPAGAETPVPIPTQPGPPGIEGAGWVPALPAVVADTPLAAEIAAITRFDDEWLDTLRSQAVAAGEAAVKAETALATHAATQISVSEAEERLASAQQQVAQLRELDHILQLTSRFLAAAQTQTHRDIAKVLAGSLRATLPTVTAGRYTEGIVDPVTLQVSVRAPGRPWRTAELLSQGTAEQIYLLLRIALAEHLTNAGEVAPLLLDDVTVHADEDRSEQILELLLAQAQHRQIVLFTQQPQVRQWAKGRLTAPRHRLIELPVLSVV